MYKKDSDYALNKRSANIVYQFADGTRQEISLEDCLDFARWKALSDEDYHVQELTDRHISRNDLPMNEGILGSVESFFEDEMGTPCTLENALKILEQCLTETQKRRYLLNVCKGLTMRQIAAREKVNPTVVQRSVAAAKKKICETYSHFEKKGIQKAKKMAIGEGG